MISIVIPIYNEEENLHHLYDRISASAPEWKDEYEVVLVNDGSFDGSREILQTLVDKDSRIKVLHFSRNFGHQAAISAGIEYAKGDAVVIMDGDLQDPPEELNRFLNKWREGYEVVYAIRTKRKEGFFKKLAYKLFYRILHWISDISIPLDSGDFCVMDRKVVNVLKHEMPEKFRFVRGLRAFAGFKQVGVKYERHSRAAGEVKYTFRKLMGLALDGIFNFSTFPLRLATYLGVMLAIPSFLIGIFFIIHRIFDFEVFGFSPSDTPGMATLAVGMFFLFGIVLIIMGIIGEYIGRIFYEIKGRPFYVVDQVLDRKEKSD